ncbi:MAG: hypothetical protein WDW38_005805 [Sanguina aurantia]
MSGGWQAKVAEQEVLESQSSAHSCSSTPNQNSPHQGGAVEDLQPQTSDPADTQDGAATSSSQGTVAAEEARPQTPDTVADAPSQQLSEQEQVVSATKWMVHALMAPATTDSFGHEMWGHVLGCCDGDAPCPSGLNCQNVKSTMRHLLQCQDAACPLCLAISSFFSGAGRQPIDVQTPSEQLAQMVTRPHDIECLIQPLHSRHHPPLHAPAAESPVWASTQTAAAPAVALPSSGSALALSRPDVTIAALLLKPSPSHTHSFDAPTNSSTASALPPLQPQRHYNTTTVSRKPSGGVNPTPSPPPQWH